MELFHFLLGLLRDPGPFIQWAGYPGLALIIFLETGAMVFFLPGDSLLVVAGLYAAKGDLSLALLNLLLIPMAILGDATSYTIGAKTGPRIFNREKSLFFHKDHLLKAQDFYERHGGKTIVLARFMPFIRTFAPVVAGVGKMNYRSFLFFNICGGIGWVCSMILLGWSLTPIFNPLLKPLFGDSFRFQDHVEKVIIVVVLLSISPGLWHWWRSKLKPSPQPIPVPVPVEAE